MIDALVVVHHLPQKRVVSVAASSRLLLRFIIIFRFFIVLYLMMFFTSVRNHNVLDGAVDTETAEVIFAFSAVSVNSTQLPCAGSILQGNAVSACVFSIAIRRVG